jgi:hypothetical protein
MWAGSREAVESPDMSRLVEGAHIASMPPVDPRGGGNADGLRLGQEWT